MGVHQFWISVINSEFYAHVFELLLRLKANYLWLAMWDSGFYTDDKEIGPLADEYSIFISTSHHEPMARSEQEQQAEVEGPWDWRSNKDEVTEFFQRGAQRGPQWTLSIRWVCEGTETLKTQTS